MEKVSSCERTATVSVTEQTRVRIQLILSWTRRALFIQNAAGCASAKKKTKKAFSGFGVHANTKHKEKEMPRKKERWRMVGVKRRKREGKSSWSRRSQSIMTTTVSATTATTCKYKDSGNWRLAVSCSRNNASRTQQIQKKTKRMNKQSRWSYSHNGRSWIITWKNKKKLKKKLQKIF